MLNDDGIENGKKKKERNKQKSNNNNNMNKFNQQKKKNNFASATHFFLVHFFATIIARLQRETFQLHVLRRKCRMFSQKNCGLCSYSLSFSMPLIFTLLAVNISHFHTTTIKFLCGIFNEICLLRFSSLALVLLCYPLHPRRLNLVEKETAWLFFFL